jgi:hypothetical protein
MQCNYRHLCVLDEIVYFSEGGRISEAIEAKTKRQIGEVLAT